MPHLQSNMLTAWIRKTLLCTVWYGSMLEWMLWELILLVLVDLSHTEIILTQFSVNLDSRVWKLYKNAFHVSLSLDKTCIWLGIGGVYHKNSHFFPTTLLTESTWLMLFSRRYQFYMKPCAASSPPSLHCSMRAHLVLLFEKIHAKVLY